MLVSNKNLHLNGDDYLIWRLRLGICKFSLLVTNYVNQELESRKNEWV